MNANSSGEHYINLGELADALLRRLGVLILTAVLCAAIGFGCSAFFVRPLYSASAMMIVNAGEKYPDYVSTDQLNSAATLVDTYSIIIKSDTVMNQVIENLRMEDTFKTEVRDISVSAVNETQVMQITVRATDPNIALDVCKEITNVAPGVLQDVVEAGSVNLVSEAHSTFRRVSPNIKLNTLLAGVMGLLAAALVIIVLTLLDNKINNENDIRQFDLPILGVIPTYEKEEK